MKKLFYKMLVVLVAGIVVFGFVATCLGQKPLCEVLGMIAAADVYFDWRHHVEAKSPGEYLAKYHDWMAETILIYEIAIYSAEEPLPLWTQRHVLDRLAQLFYELTTYHSPTEENRATSEKFLGRGKEYGLRSLELNPSFDRNRIEETVQYIDDPAALLWTADNWGEWLRYYPLEGLAGGSKPIKALLERLLEVEPGFQGGSGYNALGVFLVSAPPALGGDKERGLAYLKKAVEEYPSYLMNHLVYADCTAFERDMFGQRTGINDLELIRREVFFVLDAPIDDAFYQFPLWNWKAKKQAEELWQQIQPLLEHK